MQGLMRNGDPSLLPKLGNQAKYHPTQTRFFSLFYFGLKSEQMGNTGFEENPKEDYRYIHSNHYHYHFLFPFLSPPVGLVYICPSQLETMHQANKVVSIID